MSEPREIDLGEPEPPRSAELPRPRAVGSPLAVGASSRGAVPPAEPRSVPPERALSGSTGPNEPGDQPTSLQRAMNGLRMAWPFVQKVLPLLDGQVITAISNLLAPHPPRPAQVNLAPLEGSVTELQARHVVLGDQVAEQNAALKRVEDRLELVREATDRNTLEQQELMDDLKRVGRKVNLIAVVALILLAASIAVNVVLYLHIQRVLP